MFYKLYFSISVLILFTIFDHLKKTKKDNLYIYISCLFVYIKISTILYNYDIIKLNFNDKIIIIMNHIRTNTFKESNYNKPNLINDKRDKCPSAKEIIWTSNLKVESIKT